MLCQQNNNNCRDNGRRTTIKRGLDHDSNLFFSFFSFALRNFKKGPFLNKSRLADGFEGDRRHTLEIHIKKTINEKNTYFWKTLFHLLKCSLACL